MTPALALAPKFYNYLVMNSRSAGRSWGRRGASDSHTYVQLIVRPLELTPQLDAGCEKRTPPCCRR